MNAISVKAETVRPQQSKRSIICYASRTGTKRNLEALRKHGWGLLISRAGVWRTEGFNNWVGDNGAWADFKAGRDFDEDKYKRFLDWVVAQPFPPAWLVLPDIVEGGLYSLDLSIRYMNRCLAIVPMVLIAVQDGMMPDDLTPLVGPRVGIFLGGSTKWKLEMAATWGVDFCAPRSVYFHFARANSIKRISLAIFAKADSIDGSSASRYAESLPKLAYAARQYDLFT